jgi:hypothetical protein
VLGADADSALCRVAPLPGTLDHGVGVAHEICEEYSSWVRYGLDEVRAAVSAAPRPAVTASTGPKTGPDFSADGLRRRGVGAELVEAIITGRVPSHPPSGRTASATRRSRPSSALTRAAAAASWRGSGTARVTWSRCSPR